MPEADTEHMPKVVCITVGMFQENCYLYACPETLEAVIIDPGDEAERIIEHIQQYEFIPKYIINTHGHIDHICAIDAVSAVYPVPLAIHPDDVSMYTDERPRACSSSSAACQTQARYFALEGDTISFGTLTLEVVHTPGHTRGGICLVSRPYCVFSGDTLFRRGIGRTDFQGGNYEQIEKSIREKLYTLDDELVVLPGHGQTDHHHEEKYENPFVNIEE